MHFSVSSSDAPLHYASLIPEDCPFSSVIWNGFQKSIYSAIQFDSRPELVFASVLERDSSVLEWIKPPRRKAIINGYEPDFFVETEEGRYLCEIKRSSECGNEEVLAKSEKATEWCETVNEHSAKPWKYLLIPHDKVAAHTSFDVYLQYEWQNKNATSADALMVQ